VVVYLIKRFIQINSAQINSVSSFEERLDYLTDSINRMATAYSLFEAKLFSITLKNLKKITKFFNNTMFKLFRDNGTNCYPSKIFTYHSLIDTILWFRKWYNITVPEIG